jgi:SAM-dependent methyltransferase
VTGHPEFWQARLPEARVVPDDETLALQPGAQDLVVHALALHWANDPVGQLIQARRALRPDGLFLGVTFGGRSLAELRAVLAEAEVALTGGLSPRVLPMADVRDLGGLLQRAGLALPVADTAQHVVTYDDLDALIADLRAMGETAALTERDRRAPPRRLFETARDLYAQSFPAGDGRIRATAELVYLTGWAPDESQPKPLRPGSATARLADALGTVETPSGDTAPRRGD